MRLLTSPSMEADGDANRKAITRGERRKGEVEEGRAVGRSDPPPSTASRTRVLEASMADMARMVLSIARAPRGDSMLYMKTLVAWARALQALRGEEVYADQV